jgi:hypothetical protein
LGGNLAARAERLLVALRGRQVTCRVCGRPIARLAFSIRSGRIRVLGLGGAVVRVRFSDRHELVFEHADSQLCERRLGPPVPGPDAPAA